tara:strand:- start:346 stop:567 length:222 start_codon:yes stop_codon:yes gene_type:complete
MKTKNNPFIITAKMSAIAESCEWVSKRYDISPREKSAFILKKMRELSALQKEADETLEKLGKLVRPINRELQK